MIYERHSVRDDFKNNIIQPVFDIPPLSKKDEEFRSITSDMVNNVKPYYLVSNYGRIYNIDSQTFINGYSDKNGYNRVVLRLSNRERGISQGVHRLMLLAFDGIPENKDMVPNHIDGIKNHNVLSNLEWATPAENAQHALKTGLHDTYDENSPNNKLTENQVRQICKLIESGKYHDTEIAKMFNVSYTNISDIHNGVIWGWLSKDYDMSIKTPAKKFLEKDIRNICEDIASGKLYIYEIAKKYNTSEAEIIAIKAGKIWKDVSKDYDFSNPKKKIYTDKTIREICEYLLTGVYSYKEISDELDVPSNLVRNIANGNTHRDIAKEYGIIDKDIV